MRCFRKNATQRGEQKTEVHGPLHDERSSDDGRQSGVRMTLVYGGNADKFSGDKDQNEDSKGSNHPLNDDFRNVETSSGRRGSFFNSIASLFLGTSTFKPVESNDVWNKSFESLLMKLGVQVVVQKTLMKSLSAEEKKRAVTVSSGIMNDISSFSKEDEELLSYLSIGRSTDSILLLILRARISRTSSRQWIKSFCAALGMLTFNLFLSKLN